MWCEKDRLSGVLLKILLLWCQLSGPLFLKVQFLSPPSSWSTWWIVFLFSLCMYSCIWGSKIPNYVSGIWGKRCNVTTLYVCGGGGDINIYPNRTSAAHPLSSKSHVQGFWGRHHPLPLGDSWPIDPRLVINSSRAKSPYERPSVVGASS